MLCYHFGILCSEHTNQEDEMSLKEVYMPHLGFTVKMGCKAPRESDKRMMLKLSNYELAAPSAPVSCDYSPKAMVALSNSHLNTQLGDCVIAGGYHVKELLLANAGRPKVFSNPQIMNDYSQIGGYVPGNPATDRGCVITDALHHWVVKGWQDHSKLSRWLSVDHTRPKLYKFGLWLFENLLHGCALPNEWLQITGSGFVWDAGVNNPNNGHCFMATGYDQNSTIIDTWGLLGRMTDAACVQDVSEMYVLVDYDMVIRASKKAPNNFNWTQLLLDLKFI